jgi:hypothetical protein
MNPNRDLDVDVAKFDFLWPLAYPKFSKVPLLTKVVKQLVKDDVIQFGQLWEKAIEAQLKIVRESSEGKDFKNGDDAKLVSVRTHARGKSYGANIPGVHNKIGKLLVAVYEKKQRQWFFFKIPNTAFAYIASSSNIEIPFELNGTPRRIPKRRDATNWWKYEVASFQKLK